jgi:hypothetical protein
MTGKAKTKLLKIVCKRAELMRAPYRASSWTCKTSRTDKKSLSVNKTGKTFRSIKSDTTKYGEKIVSNPEGMYYRKIHSTFNNF